VVKPPLAAAPGARDSRDTGLVGSERVVCHGSVLLSNYLNAAHVRTDTGS
jgi:hypothetical protein